MDNQALLENYRTWLANTLTNDAQSVISILNKNGFPTSTATGNSKLIEQSLKGLQVSKSFGDDLNKLIYKNNVSSIHNFIGADSSKKSNFAAQPQVTTVLGTDTLLYGPTLGVPSSKNPVFFNDPFFL
jgi:hypothetical protein